MQQGTSSTSRLLDDTAACSPAPCSAVLDTNVVLDLLVFEDRRVQALASALATGRVLWLASAHMRSEFEAVIARPALLRYRVDKAAALAAFDARAAILPPALTQAPGLSCRDSADQCFVDFALAHRVPLLLSHDRDLLALARPARRLGLLICSPQAWAASCATAADRSSPAAATHRG